MDPDFFQTLLEMKCLVIHCQLGKINLPDVAIDFACLRSSGEEQEGRPDHGL